MKICLAQVKSFTGDVEKNIAHHLEVAKKVIAKKADLIVFSELSLTGYEPTLAQELAMEVDDKRLTPFQALSNEHGITIGVGLPIKTSEKPQIGLLFFEPKQEPRLYCKHYLHEDELPFFSPGPNYTGSIAGNDALAIAVCYELTIGAHAEAAFERNASIYLASVAKTPSGVDKAGKRLADIAKEHNMITLMVNCVGVCEGQTAGGKSAVWNKRGQRLTQLATISEGLLVYDTCWSNQENDFETIEL